MSKFLRIVLTLGLFTSACSQAPTTESNSETKRVDDSLKPIDVLKSGPYESTEYEYDSGPYLDKDIASISESHTFKIDIRGRLYLPQGAGPFPLVVLLHGNHGTCGEETGPGNPRIDQGFAFTDTGICPPDHIEAPSYRGFDASARLLASWGFAVTSINANRGITGQRKDNRIDSTYVLARGILVLRHIEELAKWSREGKNDFLKAQGLDLSKKLDLNRVGLMGHSRGGEGVRFAYNSFANGSAEAKWKERIPGLKVRGIFEIGPIDAGTDSGAKKVEAEGVAWTVLIPGCDADVPDFSGVHPFERMLKNMNDGFPKSVFTIWGANHNFFNSQWQVSDAPHRCLGHQTPLWNLHAEELPHPYNIISDNARAQLVGSDTQIKLGKALMAAFFRAHLGHGQEQEFRHIFDPQYRLPNQLASLAPSSRQYFLAADSKSVFDPETALAGISTEKNLSALKLRDHIALQIDAMTEGLQAYAESHNWGPQKAKLLPGALIRPAVFIEGKGDLEAQAIVLPLSQIQSAKGFWTLDLTLALRKGCNHFDEGMILKCPALALDDSFEVALVLEDGTVTSAVNIDEYVTLGNWYSDYFQKLYSYFESANDYTAVFFRYIPILYQTARFELTDFNVRDQNIKGLQLRFKSGDDISLIVQSMRLTKREGR